MKRKRHIMHLLYSGLGGHGSVFRSLFEADEKAEFQYSALYYGIEPIREGYVDFCQQKEIPFAYVRKRPGLDLLFFARIFWSLVRAKPDVIFVHGSYLFLIARMASKISGSRVVVRETQANHLKTKWEWRQLKLALRYCRYLVFLTEQYKDDVMQKWPGFANRKGIFVIPNGLNLKEYESLPTKSDTTSFRIGMVGRLVKIKDHSSLIKAMPELLRSHPEIELEIYGGGDCFMELEKLINDLDLSKSVFLKGSVTETQIPQVLSKLDLYVHATWGETMSTSIMQAQAAGLPIIASDVKGVNNVIEQNKNGLLVPPGNSEAIVKAISQILDDGDLRIRLKNGSLQYADDNLSAQKMFNSYRDIFVMP